LATWLLRQPLAPPISSPGSMQQNHALLVNCKLRVVYKCIYKVTSAIYKRPDNVKIVDF
jgi:hypothetical protein